MRYALILIVSLVLISSSDASIFTVINTNDSGAGSLRQAILSANTSAGLDTINFNIPGSGVHTITVASDLPTITSPVIIDGYTQGGATANTLAVGNNAALKIEINGNSKGGFLIATGGDGSTIKGLVINRFGCDAAGTCGGIRLRANNNIISGNFIGTDVAGAAEMPNFSEGVLVSAGSNNLIGGTTPAARNLISGNTGAGGFGNIAIFPSESQVEPPPTGTIIRGNYIGTNASGTVSLHPKAFQNLPGIKVFFGSNTIIGGTDADDGVVDGNVGSRNLMSGNSEGIQISGDAIDGVTIEGNFIGVNAAGTAAVTNFGGGIDASNTTTGITNIVVGGTAAGAGNVISGNTQNGVFLSVLSATVQGNYIGTNAAGTAAIPNGIDAGEAGVALEIGGSEGPNIQMLIGGTTPAARNVISGNTNHGILLSGIQSGLVTIQGNYIGVSKDGHTPLGNQLDGIHSARPTLVGGTVAGAGNVIANNARGGVSVVGDSANTVTVEGNSIYGNGLPGIDLTANGAVEPNDVGDADSGVNNLQNYPVISSVISNSGMTTIKGTLNSTASTTFRVELFANDMVDGTDFGEGKTFLGSANVSTNAGGNGSFTVMVPKIAGQPHITATATDPNGKTSEFSPAYGQLLNISTRENVLTGNGVLIGGFIVSGDVNKTVLVRALGPTLTQLGVPGALGDTTLELHDGAGTLLATNDNWKDTQQAQIMATGKAPPSNLESAILRSLAPGNYTAILRGKNNTTGVGEVEVYDLDDTVSTTLTNISSRGFVDVGANVMIGGFISGDGQAKVIVRALGPTLAQFGVPNVLADPVLELHDAQGSVIGFNDNWATAQQAEIQASGFAPPDANEPAIIVVRPSGNTTAIVSGKGGGATGNALVEVYQIP